MNYDQQIQAAAELHLNKYDWRLYKAQLIAESNLNPTAVSPVGAKGIAQFMPPTWRQIRKEMQFPKVASATDPKYAIPAGAYYMAKLLRKWSAPRPDMDRYCLALASYNAGFGSLLNAQKKAHGANDYKTIAKHLHLVTGKHSTETINYIKRILGTFIKSVVG